MQGVYKPSLAVRNIELEVSNDDDEVGKPVFGVLDLKFEAINLNIGCFNGLLK